MRNKFSKGKQFLLGRSEFLFWQEDLREHFVMLKIRWSLEMCSVQEHNGQIREEKEK